MRYMLLGRRQSNPPIIITLDGADESPVGSPFYHISMEGGVLNLVSHTLRQDYDGAHTYYAQGEARYTVASTSSSGRIQFGYDLTNAAVTNANVGAYGRLNDYTAVLGTSGMYGYWFRTYGATNSNRREILKCLGTSISVLAYDNNGAGSGTFTAEWNGASLRLTDGDGSSWLETSDGDITVGTYWGIFTHLNGSGSGYAAITPNIVYTPL